MLVADSYLGHRSEAAVADRLATTDPLQVALSDTERRRSRVRTETTDGRDLGIVVGRDLSDGDVLETEDGSLVVVELDTIEALALALDETDVSALAALELGHAIGNRHWNIAVRDGEVLVPVGESRDRMESTVDDHLPAVSKRYESVSPTLFDDSDHGHDHGHGTHVHGVRSLDGDDS
jgi:urease accessory protein